MRMKDGVLFDRDGVNAQPELFYGLWVVAEAYRDLGITGKRACVTSVMDGKHSTNSLHYKGFAFDIRTWADEHGTQMCDKTKLAFRNLLAERLGDDWDVVVERSHIHVEYDPR